MRDCNDVHSSTLNTAVQCDLRLDRSGIRTRVRLHGEVNSQGCLVDVGDDDVSCRYHLPETFDTLLNTNRRRTNDCEQRQLHSLDSDFVTKEFCAPDMASSISLFSCSCAQYLF